MSRPKHRLNHLMFVDGRATKEYRAYQAMQHRRGRTYAGIEVDPFFLDKEYGFERFLNDVGKCPDIGFDLGRINNDLGYEPGNIRWESRRDNLANRSVTLMVVNYDGSEEALTKFCDRTHKNHARLRQRYKVRKTRKLHASELS